MSLAVLDPAGPPPKPPMGIVAPHKETTSLTAFKDITFGSVSFAVTKLDRVQAGREKKKKRSANGTDILKGGRNRWQDCGISL